MSEPHIQRLAAFTHRQRGGNPAGVVIGDQLPHDAEMQRIAKEVGYSETAFLMPLHDSWRTRYFSPEREVEFCGHATIASGVALAERFGPGIFSLATNGGEVLVETSIEDGEALATLTSLPPRIATPDDALVDEALDCLGWDRVDLEPEIPPALGFAGAWHLILATEHYGPLERLHYDFERLRQLMLRMGVTTLQLVWRERADLYRSRNPFPVGGVVEDPATGAAAAALGAYLRELELVGVPGRFTILQGVEMGRPCEIIVDLITGDERVRVTGTAAASESSS